jgi:hypothetical protein
MQRCSPGLVGDRLVGACRRGHGTGRPRERWRRRAWRRWLPFDTLAARRGCVVCPKRAPTPRPIMARDSAASPRQATAVLLLVSLLVRLLLPIPRHLHRSLLCCSIPSLCTAAVVACSSRRAPIAPAVCPVAPLRCAPACCPLVAVHPDARLLDPARPVSSAIAASSHRDSLAAPSAVPI